MHRQGADRPAVHPRPILVLIPVIPLLLVESSIRQTNVLQSENV